MAVMGTDSTLKHGRSAFEFFREAVRAYTNDAPAPSLLKNP